MSADDAHVQDFRAEALLRFYEQEQSGPGPKRARLYRAMVKMISKAYWNTGQRLPPDKEFTSLVPVSVATVQGALNLMAEQGLITRKKRNGTFVAPEQQLTRETAFFNFSSADGKTIATTHDLDYRIEETTEPGPWSAFLGQQASFIRIARIVEIDRAFRVGSHFYLPGLAFRELLTMPSNALMDLSVRSHLQLHFSSPTTSMRWDASLEYFDAEMADELRVERQSVGQCFDVRLWTTGQAPLGFHRLWVPPNDRAMQITTRN